MSLRCPKCGAEDMILAGRLHRLRNLLGAVRRASAGYIAMCSRCSSRFCVTPSGVWIYQPPGALAPGATGAGAPIPQSQGPTPRVQDGAGHGRLIDQDTVKQWSEKPGP